MSADWESTSWGNLVELKYGKALKGYKDAEGEFPVFGTNGPVGWCSQPLCAFPSVIVGRKGAYRGIHFSDKPFHVIDTAFYINPKTDINLKWAYYALLLVDINGMDSGSAIPSTSRDDFYALPARIPKRHEQDWIVDQLDALNDKIELNRQINTTLESMAQALFKSWFVDFDPVIDNALAAGNDIPDALQAKAAKRKTLGAKRKPLPDGLQLQFPDRFVFTEEMGWVPEGWGVSTIGDAVETTGGGTPSTKESAFWDGGVHAFCTPKDMSQLGSLVLTDTERYLTDAGIAKVSSGLLPSGTVLMSSRAPIGYLAISNIPLSVNQGVIALLPSELYGTMYLLCWAQSNMDKVKDRANGSTFLEISKKNFRPIPFLIPGSVSLAEFNQQASSLYSRILVTSEQINQLSKLRDTLLPRLLSGELRIPEAEKQLAEAL